MVAFGRDKRHKDMVSALCDIKIGLVRFLVTMPISRVDMHFEGTKLSVHSIHLFIKLRHYYSVDNVVS